MNLTSLHEIKYLIESNYFYNFLLKYIELFFITKNFFLYKNFYKSLSILKYLKTHPSSLFLFLRNDSNNRTTKEKNFFKIEMQYMPETTSLKLSNNFIKNNNLKFCFKNLNPLKNFFFFNFLFTFSSLTSFFNYNHNHQFFFMKDFKKNLIITDTVKFLNRWKNGYNFIFNIYYYSLVSLLFGSFEFKNEILAINWHHSKFDLNFWKYSFIFFIFKTNRFSLKINHFFNKLSMSDINFFFVSNVFYHYKNIHYMTKFKFFSIGPVNSNLSPWLLSYSLPSFSTNLIIEYFFLKFLILTEKRALYAKYFFSRLNWSQLFFTQLSCY